MLHVAAKEAPISPQQSEQLKERLRHYLAWYRYTSAVEELSTGKITFFNEKGNNVIDTKPYAGHADMVDGRQGWRAKSLEPSLCCAHGSLHLAIELVVITLLFLLLLGS